MHDAVAKKWINEYGDLLYRYARLRVSDDRVAEDLVQDTFIAGLRSLDSFQERSSEKSWLYSILKNKIIDHYRSKERNHEEYFDSENSIDALFKSNGHWKEGPQSWRSNPEEALQRSEFHEILKKCIEFLPEIQQRVFSFRDIDGLCGDDICKLLGISSSNLWVLTHRARHALRDCLTVNWFGGKR